MDKTQKRDINISPFFRISTQTQNLTYGQKFKVDGNLRDCRTSILFDCKLHKPFRRLKCFDRMSSTMYQRICACHLEEEIRSEHWLEKNRSIVRSVCACSNGKRNSLPSSDSCNHPLASRKAPRLHCGAFLLSESSNAQ